MLSLTADKLIIKKHSECKTRKELIMVAEMTLRQLDRTINPNA